MSINVNNLFGNAAAEGAVSAATLEAIQVEDLGAQIQAGLGINVADVKAGEIVLVAMLPDDSGSIAGIRENPDDYKSPIIGPQLIMDGHNLVLRALRGEKQPDGTFKGGTKQSAGILIHTQYLNGRVLYPFTRLSLAEEMTSNNYTANGGTPLYDQIAVFLATILKKTQDFRDDGVPCRSVSLIPTDGFDEHSSKRAGGRGTTAADVRRLVEDMVRSEQHIILGMGIGDDDDNKKRGRPTFHDVFLSMGIPERWIMKTGVTPEEIRRNFQVFSQSAVRASQNAGGFSQVAMAQVGGGFGV